LFCIHNILVNDKCSAFGVVGDALPYLPATPLSLLLLIPHDEHVSPALDVPYRSELPKKIEEFFRCHVVAILGVRQILERNSSRQGEVGKVRLT